MSRKSGHRFSEKDMRKKRNAQGIGDFFAVLPKKGAAGVFG
jgi:hypothetical protein